MAEFDELDTLLDQVLELQRETLHILRLICRPKSDAERARDYRQRQKAEQQELFPPEPEPAPLKPYRGDSIFEQGWLRYPSRNGKKVEKKKARETFVRYVSPLDYEDWLAAIDNYAAYCNETDTLARDMVRWLPVWKDDWAPTDDETLAHEEEIPL